jgi:chorismate mutase/prephenate dehydratase
MSELERLRAELDRIDARLLDDIAARHALVRDVLDLKDREGLGLADPARETQLLARLADLARPRGLDRQLVETVWKEILAHSRRLQAGLLVARQNRAGERVRVAVGGEAGSYTEAAARRHFAVYGERASFEGAGSFRAVVDAVAGLAADFGVLPIENTTAGSINETYDLLAGSELKIVGEVVLDVEHCLLAIEGATLGGLRRIASHPQALAQCAAFLEALEGVATEPAVDTARAAAAVRERGDPSFGAIASREAAALHGLTVLKERIADRAVNRTRFVVVAREPLAIDPRIAAKTSLFVGTRHEHGALARALGVLAKHGLNLTKLESRPRPNVPWEYVFYLDFEGNAGAPEVRAALDELAGAVSFLKVLGTYPTAAESRRAEPAAPPRAEPPPVRASEPAPAAPLPAEKKAYRLASRRSRADDTVVRAGDVLVGGAQGFAVIAGPCSVESREQIFAAARAVKEAGAHLLRGGCFKPRTSPYSFQGLGLEGLALLVEAGKAFGLPVVTEVLGEADVAPVAEAADVLQIGARNMQNFPLLRAVGKVNRPVLLKRGMMASIEELLAAAEYILSAGNQQVILCERGIRTFEEATRNTLDISAVPVLRERTHLPVIVDPSHACGEARLVAPLARAAAAVGAHGIMIEVHPDPASALSDREQALDPAAFARLMASLGAAPRG